MLVFTKIINYFVAYYGDKVHKLIFDHLSNLALKLFLSPMLTLVFVPYLKYAFTVNGVNR